jgi:hypothetical protein
LRTDDRISKSGARKYGQRSESDRYPEMFVHSLSDVARACREGSQPSVS